MKKFPNLLALSVSGLVVFSIFITLNFVVYGFPIGTDPLVVLEDHETRIAVLESSDGTPTVNKKSYSIGVDASCKFLYSGNSEEPEIVKGWCPDRSHKLYLIEDASATQNSLVLINIQDDSLPLGNFVVDSTGSFLIDGEIYNGFIIELLPGYEAQTSNKLFYVVMN